MTRRSVLLSVAAWALVAAAPAHAASARPSTGDPLAQLGGESPSCKEDVGPVGKHNCAASGSVAQGYPISSYELDVHVDFGITHLGNAFLGALQNVAGLIWMGLVYLIKGVLLLLEWGFSIDLLGRAMSGVRHTLTTLHRDVIGQPWFLAALGVTALWGMWRGLVQRQATSTITGLLATIGLMVCALVVLARPADTVGYASRLASDASLSILSAATTQSLDRPTRSMAQASQGIFDSMVRDPWCALQFGSVDYCDQHPPVGAAAWCSVAAVASGSNDACLDKGSEIARSSMADIWLAHPSGSTERDFGYHVLKGDLPFALSDKLGVAKDPGRVRMQEASGTFSRFAILGLIAIGMLGAVALLAYLGIKLLLASVLALLLLLFAPAMLLAPAFGEAGRATFIAWGRRLLGALATKLVYALFLAVVLTAAATMQRLDVGWFGTWLLQIAFWWGVLIKRHELIGFVSINPGDHGRRSGLVSSLAQGYYAMQMGRTMRAAAGRMMHRPARAAQAIADRHRAARDVRAGAATREAIDTFDSDGRRVLEGEQERARVGAAARQQAGRELRVVDRRLTAFDEDHAAARAAGRPVPLPNGEQAALLRQRRALLERLHSPELRGADQLVSHAERNRAQTGEAVSARDLAAYRRRRAADLAGDLPLDHERHLRAANVDPSELAAAEPARRRELLDYVGRHLDRERRLLEAIGPEELSGGPELRFDPAAYRTRRAERLARRTREQRFERTGGHRGR
jgi:hypothetical protein